MKNKKTKVIIFTVIVLIIVAGIATFLVMKNQNSGDTGEKETSQKKPDIVIKEHNDSICIKERVDALKKYKLTSG